MAVREGVVKSVSFITNTTYFEESLAVLRRHPDISVGVHLNLTDGKPLSPPTNLRFLLNRKVTFLGSHSKVIWAVISHFTNLEHIKYEFELQIKRLLNHNINISHLDSHGYVHIIPPLFKIVSELARKFRIPFIRIPREKLSLGDYFSKWHFLGVNLLSKYIVSNLTDKQFKYTDHSFGLKDTGKLTKERLIEIIKQLSYGTTEIAVHPGYNSQTLSRMFKWNYSWYDELLALTDKEVKEEIKRNKIDLVNFCKISKRLHL
ncbi:Carbohydrate deacetylase [subsurface metagenome]